MTRVLVLLENILSWQYTLPCVVYAVDPHQGSVGKDTKLKFNDCAYRYRLTCMCKNCFFSVKLHDCAPDLAEHMKGRSVATSSLPPERLGTRLLLPCDLYILSFPSYAPSGSGSE